MLLFSLACAQSLYISLARTRNYWPALLMNLSKGRKYSFLGILKMSGETQEKFLLAFMPEFPPNLASYDKVGYWLYHLFTLPGSQSWVHPTYSILGNQCEADVRSSHVLNFSVTTYYYTESRNFCFQKPHPAQPLSACSFYVHLLSLYLSELFRQTVNRCLYTWVYMLVHHAYIECLYQILSHNYGG